MSARIGFWDSGPQFRREVDPAGSQQSPATAERALPDRVEDHVVCLVVLREVLGRVVDDPVGAQAPHQLHVLRVAGRGHVGTETLQQLDRRRADGSGCAVDEDVLPAPDLRPPDEREGIVRTLGTGSGLLVGHIRRHGREQTVFGNRHVFGMSTERAFVVPEHPVADLEGRDAGADRLDYSCELIPEDRHPWSDESAEQSHDEGLGSPEAAVRPIHRRRVNLDEHLVVSGRRLFHV